MLVYYWLTINFLSPHFCQYLIAVKNPQLFYKITTMFFSVFYNPNNLIRISVYMQTVRIINQHKTPLIRTTNSFRSSYQIRIFDQGICMTHFNSDCPFILITYVHVNLTNQRWLQIFDRSKFKFGIRLRHYHTEFQLSTGMY